MLMRCAVKPEWAQWRQALAPRLPEGWNGPTGQDCHLRCQRQRPGLQRRCACPTGRLLLLSPAAETFAVPAAGSPANEGTTLCRSSTPSLQKTTCWTRATPLDTRNARQTVAASKLWSARYLGKRKLYDLKIDETNVRLNRSVELNETDTSKNDGMAWARRSEPRPAQPEQAPRAGARSNRPWDLPWSDATDSSSAHASLRRR